MVVQRIINSVVEILLFTLVPFIWWLVTARKKQNFFEWLGIKKPMKLKENKTLLWMLGTIMVFAGLAVFILMSLRGIQTATSDFEGLGLAALPAILIYALFNTALPEEILFRGFLLKRLSNKFGFAAANIIQSLLFGLMHGVLFFTKVGVVKSIIIILFTGAIGWLMGFVNEKKSEGSIIPSWSIHAIANIFSSLCSAFMLFH